MSAGEAFSFTLDTAVYHQGPISMYVRFTFLSNRDSIANEVSYSSYMSKAPSAAADYDGSGEWFKIKDIGTSSS